jgi:hypothetical protein
VLHRGCLDYFLVYLIIRHSHFSLLVNVGGKNFAVVDVRIMGEGGTQFFRLDHLSLGFIASNTCSDHHVTQELVDLLVTCSCERRDGLPNLLY